MSRRLFSRSVGKRNVQYTGPVPQGKPSDLFFSSVSVSSDAINSIPFTMYVSASYYYSLAVLSTISDPPYFGSVSVLQNGSLSYGPISGGVYRWHRHNTVMPVYNPGDKLQLSVTMPDTGFNTVYAFMGFWRYPV